jgi:hypothetical protein
MRAAVVQINCQGIGDIYRFDAALPAARVVLLRDISGELDLCRSSFAPAACGDMSAAIDDDSGAAPDDLAGAAALAAAEPQMTSPEDHVDICS